MCCATHAPDVSDSGLMELAAARCEMVKERKGYEVMILMQKDCV